MNGDHMRGRPGFRQQRGRLKKEFLKLQSDAVETGINAVHGALLAWDEGKAPDADRPGIRRALKICEEIKDKLGMSDTFELDLAWKFLEQRGKADAKGAAQYRRALQAYRIERPAAGAALPWLGAWLHVDDGGAR